MRVEEDQRGGVGWGGVGIGNRWAGGGEREV